MLPSLEEPLDPSPFVSEPSTLAISDSKFPPAVAELWFFLPNFNSRLNPFDGSLTRGFSFTSGIFSRVELLVSDTWVLKVSVPKDAVSKLVGGVLPYSDFRVQGSSKEETRAYGAWYVSWATQMLDDLDGSFSILSILTWFWKIIYSKLTDVLRIYPMNEEHYI